MVKFRKNVARILPYGRARYRSFLEESSGSKDWRGVSLQLPPEKKMDMSESIHILDSTFKRIISRFGDSSLWIANHDYLDMPWFNNSLHNLVDLRKLFKVNGIPNSFQGCLILSQDELLTFSKNFVSYPYVVSGKKL